MQSNICYERAVCYYETDQMKIVHHSNYIRWMEEARIDFLEKIGMSYAQMESEGIMIPVLGVKCNYKKAIEFGDTFRICVELLQFNGVKLTLAYRIYNGDEMEISAKGESEHCFFDPNRKLLNLRKCSPKRFEILKALEHKKQV